MNLEILKEREIPLLRRKRVTLRYNSQDAKTPSRIGVLKDVAKKVGATEDRVAIRHIYTKFGSTESKVIAHIYKDKKTMEKYEQKKLLDKQSTKQEEKPADLKVEAKPEGDSNSSGVAEEKPEQSAKEESPKEEEKKSE